MKNAFLPVEDIVNFLKSKPYMNPGDPDRPGWQAGKFTIADLASEMPPTETSLRRRHLRTEGN